MSKSRSGEHDAALPQSSRSQRWAGRYRRWLGPGVVAGVALVSVGATLVFRSPDARTSAREAGTGTPELRVDRDRIDLGEVPLGQRVEAQFTLTNAGDEPLRFSRAPYVEVVAGCCPPSPTIGSMVLDAGQQTTLTLRFSMAGNMGGPHDFRVHLRSNDRQWGDRTLAVLSDWVTARR